MFLMMCGQQKACLLYTSDEVFVIRNNVKIPYWDLGKEGEANATADLP